MVSMKRIPTRLVFFLFGFFSYHWPATQCDGYAHDPNNPIHYGGKNPLLTPGSLLALPPSLSLNMSTIPGKKIAEALRNYGGYLVDDTAWNVGTLCVENG